jgi:hypothetical protein
MPATSDIVLLTYFSSSHSVDTILCSDRMDDGPANGLELSSIRDRKPLNDSTGCCFFVAGTKIIPTGILQNPYHNFARSYSSIFS